MHLSPARMPGGRRQRRGFLGWVGIVAALLLVVAPAISLHPSHTVDAVAVGHAMDAGAAHVDLDEHLHQAGGACHAGSGCLAAAILPDRTVLETLRFERERVFPLSLAWAARDVSPGAKPPIV